MAEHLTVVSHPLVQHKLTLMREKDTSTASFRQLLREISLLLAYEVTRGLPMTTKRIETPLEEMDAPMIEGKKQFAFAWLERQSRYNLADVSLKATKEGGAL